MQAHIVELVLNKRVKLDEEAFYEIKIWNVPKSKDFPKGIKYSMVLIESEKSIIRYDNEKPKGDHKHIKEKEEKIFFKERKELLKLFYEDVEKYKRGEL